MLEIVNAVSAAVILIFVAIVSVVMPRAPHMWGKRIAVWALAALLACQISGPWMFDDFHVTWYSAGLLAMLAGALLAWRAEARAFINCKFMLHDAPHHPQRRASDIKSHQQPQHSSFWHEPHH